MPAPFTGHRSIRLLCLAPLALGSVATAQGLPSADKLLDRAFEAMGGKAITKIESYVANSELTAPMGTMTAQITWARPHWVLVKRSVPQMGEMESGTDGKIGWMKLPMIGYQLAEGDQLESIRQEALHAQIMHLKQSFEETETKLEGVSRAEFNGAPCYELKLTKTIDGKTRRSSMYFDEKSGLVRGMRTINDAPPAPGTITITVGEWKEIGGVQFFHRVDVSGGPMNVSVKYTRIDLNAVKPEQLVVPDEVKKLAAKQGGNKDASEMTIDDFSPAVQQVIRTILDELPTDDPVALRATREALSKQAERMPGEFKKGMQFVVAKIDERLKELGGG